LPNRTIATKKDSRIIFFERIKIAEPVNSLSIILASVRDNYSIGVIGFDMGF